MVLITTRLLYYVLTPPKAVERGENTPSVTADREQGYSVLRDTVFTSLQARALIDSALDHLHL